MRSGIKLPCAARMVRPDGYDRVPEKDPPEEVRNVVIPSCRCSHQTLHQSGLPIIGQVKTILSGFTGSLTLPDTTLAAVGPARQSGCGRAPADGSVRQFDIDAAAVKWNGGSRLIPAPVDGDDALVAMRRLAGHELRITVATGGAVAITRGPLSSPRAGRLKDGTNPGQVWRIRKRSDPWHWFEDHDGTAVALSSSSWLAVRAAAGRAQAISRFGKGRAGSGDVSGRTRARAVAECTRFIDGISQGGGRRAGDARSRC